MSAPPTGSWLASSFTGPEDGQPWHSVFYVAAVERPQLITRHSGLMIRCTEAPVTNNLKIAFAFGAVLRTNTYGEIAVAIALDGRSEERLKLVTRNQANAEFLEPGAKRFLQQLLDANTLRFSARLNPKGNAQVDMPLAPGREKVNQMLNKCGINLAADVRKEQSIANTRQVAKAELERQPLHRSPLERAVASYLAANNAAELAETSASILALQPSVSSVITAIKAPQALGAGALAALPGRGGDGVSSRVIDGVQLPFHVSVPASRPPAEGLPLALVLHGGLQRPPWREGERWWQDFPFNNLLSDFLVVSPAGWREARWWGDVQQQNLSELIAQIKRHYQVDESRVFVVGVSDGAAGAMHQAMTAATPLAGVVSLIGHPGVLFENHVNAGAEPQFANLSQVPIFMANGGADQRMPRSSLAPWVQSMRALGVTVASHTELKMGHSLDFGSGITAELDKFLQQHRRETDPVELAWEAGSQQLPARHRWLVIEALQAGAKQGCVRTRRGRDGSYRLQTEGIATLRVLIDHDRVQALRMTINANTSNPLIARLESAPSLSTLLRWHSRDGGLSQFFSTEHLVEIESNALGVCQSSIAHTIVADADRERLRQARQLRADQLRASNPLGGARPQNSAGGGGLPVNGGSSEAGQAQGDPTRIERPGERRR